MVHYRVIGSGHRLIHYGVFAAGTAAFTSASLVTISVALTTLCLILGAGVFGLVAAMWMISEMTKENPLIHRVVHSESEADNFIITRNPEYSWLGSRTSRACLYK